jgi:hypothetical protein
MATGVSTTNIDPDDALDEIIGNVTIDGIKRTRRVSVANFATQIADTAFGSEVGRALLESADSAAARAVLNVQQTRDINPNFASMYWSGPFVPGNNKVTIYSGTDYIHFGTALLDKFRGRYHVFMRRSAIHGADQSDILHWYTDDGFTFVGPVVLFSSLAGRDWRDLSCGIAINGDIHLFISDVDISLTAPTIFRKFTSTDGAVTFAEGNLLDTPLYSYARVRGRCKLIPGSAKNKMVVTGFKQITATPSYRMAAYYSTDQGKTFVEGTAPFQGGGESEGEVAFINAYIGFAVARKGSAGSFAYTIDGGVTWTRLSDLYLGADGDVAFSLDIVNEDGWPWIFVGLCARTPDRMRWQSARYDKAIELGGAAFTHVIDTASDMISTSGYHCPQFLDNGEFINMEVAETSGAASRVIRTYRGIAKRLITQNRSWTPVLTDALGNTVAHAVQNGRYSMFGDHIEFNWNLQLDAAINTTTPVLAAGSQLRITGLPFKIYSASDSGYRGGAKPHFVLGVDGIGTTIFGLDALPVNNSNYMILHKLTSAGSAPLTVDDLSRNTGTNTKLSFHGSGKYTPESAFTA